MPISQIQQIRIGKLRPNPANARTHSKKQIVRLEHSIQEVGFIVPIVADENFVVLAGHARLQAARSLRLPSVPVVIASGLSEARRRAFVLADNRIAEAAGWDRSALACELTQLAPLLEEAELSIDLTGFEPAEIDSLLGDIVDPRAGPGRRRAGDRPRADQPTRRPLAARPPSSGLWRCEIYGSDFLPPAHTTASMILRAPLVSIQKSFATGYAWRSWHRM